MATATESARVARRRFLALGAALGLAPIVCLRPAQATPETMAAAIRATIGAAKPNRGRVTLTVPPLVENGNVVPLSVAVESKMTVADHVRRIHVFAEKNPQPYVVSFHLGPRAGRASVATRIRLADSQHVIAIAEMSDGSLWSDSADVVVTLAACLEETP